VNPWKLILATVVIFGSGVVLGVVLDYATHSHAKSSHHSATTVATANHTTTVRPIVEVLNLHEPDLLRQEFIQKLDDELQLTGSQREAIHKIFADGQEQNHAIWTNCAAQSRQVLLEVRLHVREQLNPDQIKQFEKILRQMHPAPHKTTNTNAVPMLPAATNDFVLKSTNVVSN
jgi:hypothetical protein